MNNSTSATVTVHHLGTSELTPWLDVPLCTEDGEDLYDSVEADRVRRVAFLSEYRRTNGIAGAYLCSAATLASLGADDATDEGPSVAEIDWTGFPDAR